MKYRLVAFDLDGTLINEVVYIWTLLHRTFDVDMERRNKAMQRFYNGETTFREWAEHDIGLWVERGVTKDDFMGVIKTLNVMPGALQTLNELKRKGLKLAIISGGIDTVLNHFFPEAGKLFDHVMINRITFDGKGRITGIEPTEFGADRHKIDGLRKIADKEGIDLEECVFVGDSDNDIDVARGAGLSIGFRPHEKLAEVCDVIVKKKDLREILKYIV